MDVAHLSLLPPEVLLPPEPLCLSTKHTSSRLGSMPTRAQGWEVASQEMGTTRPPSTGRPRPRRTRGAPTEAPALGRARAVFAAKGSCSAASHGVYEC